VAKDPFVIRVVYVAMRMRWIFVDAAPGCSQSSGLARVCRGPETLCSGIVFARSCREWGKLRKPWMSPGWLLFEKAADNLPILRSIIVPLHLRCTTASRSKFASLY